MSTGRSGIRVDAVPLVSSVVLLKVASRFVVVAVGVAAETLTIVRPGGVVVLAFATSGLQTPVATAHAPAAEPTPQSESTVQHPLQAVPLTQLPAAPLAVLPT